jgi:urea-proton symporter
MPMTLKLSISSTPSSAVGGIGNLYDLLKQAGLESPVPGNADGSFLTMKSNSGIIFGVITIMTG